MSATSYKSGNVGANIAFLLVGVFFFVSSFFIDRGIYPIWSSGMIVPALLSAVMIGSAAHSLAQAIKARRAGGAIERTFEPRVMGYIAAFLVYIGALFVVPFWLASSIFLLFSFLYWKSLSLVNAIVVSVAVVALSMTLFAKVFYIVF
ncbi:hypothetical protein RA307_02305 [Xanthobacteraceae bacterium Astr-EGSB]|uniref:tripartite tricarboxylate transporter TctB family protein n=1 Tax=Astrobacterium formosum TaxID=3069710 RepID=UPI0027AE19F9|nr:hypothetical protein [Xanthobacteraceae bacterium Astr-EGSB]